VQEHLTSAVNSGRVGGFQENAPTLLGTRPKLPVATYKGEGRRLAQSLADVQLQDFYATGELKGSGSYGTVRLARARLTDKECVVKTMIKAELPPELYRFVSNELTILSFCDHPNIVRLYHTLEDDTHVHCAMESCMGGELESIGIISEAEAFTLMNQVFRGVHYLHSVLHIAHRDMKLENVLLKYADRPFMENQVKIIDFGFAEHVKPDTAPFTDICGTPGYIAPEVLEGSYGEKCDIFSCGVMLYVLLCGCCPFEVDPAASTLADAMPSDFHRGRLSFREPHWRTISGKSKLLLMQLCRADPRWRISSQQAMKTCGSMCSQVPEHKVLEEVSSMESMAQELLEEKPADYLRQEALMLVAYHLEDQEVDKERRLFQALDQDANGCLSEDECSAFWHRLGICDSKHRELFHKMDVDGTGLVSYTEFLSRAIQVQPRACCSREALLAAFCFFDADNSGKISLEELKCILQRQPQITSQDCQSILDQFDVNEDGGLDLDEFRKVLRWSSSASSDTGRLEANIFKS